MTNEKHDPALTEELKFCQKELDTSIGKFKQDVIHTSYQVLRNNSQQKNGTTVQEERELGPSQRELHMSTEQTRNSGNHPVYEEQEIPMKHDFIIHEGGDFIHNSSTHQYKGPGMKEINQNIWMTPALRRNRKH